MNDVAAEVARSLKSSYVCQRCGNSTPKYPERFHWENGKATVYNWAGHPRGWMWFHDHQYSTLPENWSEQNDNRYLCPPCVERALSK